MSYSYEDSDIYENFDSTAQSNESRLINYANIQNEQSLASTTSYAAYAVQTANNNLSSTDSTAHQVANDLLRLSQHTSYDQSKTSSYLSEIEQAMLRSQVPISIEDAEEITVLGQKGVWANKKEVINWRGVIPIEDYKINEDSNPEIITKRHEQSLTYLQELAIRYLRPPTPPNPGEIIIQQETNKLTPPAPPLIIRQQPARPATPEPLVIREAPPSPPSHVGRKVITIGGKNLPPPPRKVIIERLAPLPAKPQSVIIERWLPYSQVKRRVIYQRSNESDAVVVRPKNVIIQWESPQVQVRKDLKYLGIIRANPVEYVKRYGPQLKSANELPDFVLDIKPPQGVVLAADFNYNKVYELEGEVKALKLIDLDKEGLSEYRSQLEKILSEANVSGYSQETNYNYDDNNIYRSSNSSSRSHVLQIITDIFNQVDRDRNGSLSVEEAEKLLLKLNSRLGRRYGENDVRKFFLTLEINQDGSISLNEFRKAFENLL